MMVLLALQKMLEWCIPVVITRESTDTQGILLVKSNTKMD